MRHGRAKAARRTLQFFKRAIVGFRPPYHILLDGTFVVAVVKNKLISDDSWTNNNDSNDMNSRQHHQDNSNTLPGRIDRLLQHATFDFITTRSVLNELETLEEHAKKRNKPQQEAMFQLARTWAANNCSRIIEEQDLPEEPAIPDQTEEFQKLSVVSQHMFRLLTAGNCTNKQKQQPEPQVATTKNDETTSKSGVKIKQLKSAALHHPTYILASQDAQLLDWARRGGEVCIPIVRLARAVLLLEQPSKFAFQEDYKAERSKWRQGAGNVNEAENNLVELVKTEQKKEKQQATVQQPRQVIRRKPKAKGPNPLACKKKKRGEENPSASKRRKKTSAT